MLKNFTLNQYIEQLASPLPTPGGGSSLALVASNALALCEMALNVTINKLEKNKKDTVEQNALKKEFAKLKEQCVAIIDNDAQSFEQILTAMRLPKNDEKEKVARQKELELAYQQSAKVCLNLMSLSATGYKLANDAISLSDKFVASDAKIGKDLLKTVTNCCIHNVDINIQCIADTDTRELFEKEKVHYLSMVNE